MHRRSSRSLVATALAGLLTMPLAALSGCAERRGVPGGSEARTISSAVRAPNVRRSEAPRDRSPLPSALPFEPAAPVEPNASAAPDPSSAAPTDQRFVLDEIVDVAPAGPATAHVLGVVMVDKNDGIHLARRAPLPRGPAPASSPVAPLNLERGALAPYARGPAIAGQHAYWISRGRLVRRRLDGASEPEVLATDARTGTRVAAGSLEGGPVFVVYVVAPGEDGVARAKLWTETAKPRELTPDGSGASSVAVVRQTRSWIVLSLDGRSGMTPLHARRVLPKGKDIVLGPDVVVWVGSGAQSTTEVMSAARGEDVWALVPIARDVTHFGLAQIHVGRVPQMEAESRFAPFENGLNTSPVAAASVCGQSVVVYARPSAARPGAPQELVLAELSPEGLAPGNVLVRSRAFADVSLATLQGGALLSYTADHRTWAATLRCRP